MASDAVDTYHVFMNTNTQANPDRIRELRVAKGWSQEDLAKEAKLGLSTVQRAEEGKSVRLGTLATLASLFGVGVEDIGANRRNARAGDAGATIVPARGLGKYGPLLAALRDASTEVHHWRRHFSDTFQYRGFFIREPNPALFGQLEAVAPAAATVSLSLHRDVHEAVAALKRMHRRIQDAGGCIRGHANVGYRISVEAQDEIRLGGTSECDAADFHLRRAEAELRAFMGVDSAA